MAARGWEVLLMLTAALAVQAQDRPCNRASSELLESEGLGAMRARDYPLAQKRLTEAFDACPENPSVLLELAHDQLSGRNFDGAIRTSRQYLASNPASTAGRLALANAYLMAVRLKEAMAEADSILRDHPSESGALKIKANAAYLANDVETAKATFIRLLDRY